MKKGITKIKKWLKKTFKKGNKSTYFMAIFMFLGFLSGILIWNGFFLPRYEIKNINVDMPFVLPYVFDVEDLEYTIDNSLTKYVDSNISFLDKGYIPDNLVYLKSEYVADSKGGQLLRSEANDALQMMAKQFYDTFGVRMLVVSAYRSYEYQAGIKQRGCPDSLCAKPGYSEHQSGLAVDLWEATTKDEFLSKPLLKKYYNWLEKYAHVYGFHNSYQKGIQIDTYHEEPWHWRYVGQDLATYLKNKNMTFSEYMYTKD